MSEPCKIFMIERFAKTTFGKMFILNVWQGFKYSCGIDYVSTGLSQVLKKRKISKLIPWAKSLLKINSKECIL